MRALWRRVFHRYWWTLGWGNEGKSGRSHVTWSLCLSEINRPSLRWSRHQGSGRLFDFVVLEWGNQNSDPVWSIGYEWADKR